MAIKFLKAIFFPNPDYNIPNDFKKITYDISHI